MLGFAVAVLKIWGIEDMLSLEGVLVLVEA